jgi:hypothetical protein
MVVKIFSRQTGLQSTIGYRVIRYRDYCHRDTIKLIVFPRVLKMLGKLGGELPLRQRLSNVPRITTIIIKDAPNRWGCRGSAVLLTASPASWIAARLGSAGGLHPLSAGLLLLSSTDGLHWASAGLLLGSPVGPHWSFSGLVLSLLGHWCCLGSRLGCHLLLLLVGWFGWIAQFGELLLSKSSPSGCSGRRLTVNRPVSDQWAGVRRCQRVVRVWTLPPALHQGPFSTIACFFFFLFYIALVVSIVLVPLSRL